MPVAATEKFTDPLVSVIVPTHQGAERLPVCLGTLVNQSLGAEQFEVIVVQNGPPCETPAVVERMRRAHPRHSIRLLHSVEAGAGRARNLGIDAARGAWLTFVDDDDWVSANYLAALLENARPGRVPLAYVADVPDGTAPGEAEPDFDNYLSRPLLRNAGRTLPLEKVPSALSANAGKLIPTAVARAVRYDTTLTSGEDFVFWIGAFARAPFDVQVTPRRRSAVYYRTMRHGSVSRQDLSYRFNVLERLDCIAALHRIPDPNARTARQIRAAVSGQVARIHAFLSLHPESHGQILEDAVARGVQTVVPWRQVNRGMARDLAILYCFTPYLDTSALVAARRLRARGLITDVISQDLDNIREKDPASMAIAHEFLDEVAILPGSASFAAWEPTRRFIEGTRRRVRAFQSQKGKYRTLYSRAMAPQSHLAAALVKLENPDIEWTAEFSDPLLMNAYGEERVGDIGDDDVTEELARGIAAAGFDVPDTRQLFSWAEQVAYALADHVVFTNEHQRDFMLGYCRNPDVAARARSISTVSPHPTLPSRFYHARTADYALPPDRVHIGYFGQFYLTRGLTEVTAALESLTAAERARVRLHVFTDNPERLELEALRRGLTDVVAARPYVPFLEFLNLTTQFDALLVNDAATSQHHHLNPYLPSKLSDYLGSGTPIWAIYEPGSVLSRTRTEFMTPLGDVDAAARVLREIIDSRVQPTDVSQVPIRSVSR